MRTFAGSRVQTLFNGKANTWMNKYGPGGAFNSRREKFVARVRKSCPAPGYVLDLGCGTGNISVAIAGMGYHVTACDIAESMVDVARRSWAEATVEWVPLDPGWCVLPFEDNGFDCVVAASVFEYLDDLEGVTTELSRVLGPGGVLLFSVPNPFSMVRRIECWFRLMVPGSNASWITQRFSRIHAYVSYLQLSRNRYSGERWKALLAQAGMLPVDEREFAEETWRQEGTSLILLAARKGSA